MIRVVGKSFIKADKVNEFITLAKKLVQETNQNDAGCISYELYQDETNPQILTIMEQWENKEELQQHIESKHFKELSPKFKDMVEKPIDANFYHKLS